MNRMDQNEIRSVIEAILIASAEPVTATELATALDVSVEEIEASVTVIAKTIEEAVGGFMLERVAGGLRLATRPEFDPQVRKFFSRRRDTRMSLAALETLAIIAYRQPVSGPEVSELRGVNSSAVLRTLLERRMIRIAGRKNVVGSPFLYRTTKEFLLHFGLERIQDLPKIEEFGELLGEQVQDDLGFADLEDEAARTGESPADTELATDADERASGEEAGEVAEPMQGETPEDGVVTTDPVYESDGREPETSPTSGAGDDTPVGGEREEDA
jgi:segregation and condensation protein B